MPSLLCDCWLYKWVSDFLNWGGLIDPPSIQVILTDIAVWLLMDVDQFVIFYEQIEEKKKREEEEKRRLQQEEELLMKRIEEDNLRIQKEQEEEKKKQREKAEEVELSTWPHQQLWLHTAT